MKAPSSKMHDASKPMDVGFFQDIHVDAS